MRKILRKVAIIVWILYVAFGVLSCFMGIPQLLPIFALPSALGLALVLSEKPAKPSPVTTASSVAEPQAPATPNTPVHTVLGKVSVEEICEQARLSVPTYAVLDIETTGMSAENDHIIEVAVIKVHDGQVVDRYESLVNPQRGIPPHITKLTGIANKDVKNAPKIETVIQKINSILPEGIPLVAHNAPFDVSFISEAFAKSGISRKICFIDTLPLSKEAFPEMKNHKLSTLISELGLLEHDQLHRAMSDVEAAHNLYLRCKEALSTNCADTAQEYAARNSVHPSGVKQTASCADPSHPFYGKNLVFTGNLSMPRSAATLFAANAGAIIKSGVSSKTDYLVVGEQDISLVGTDGISDKEEKAYDLNRAGKSKIKIIREDEFMELLGTPIK